MWRIRRADLWRYIERNPLPEPHSVILDFAHLPGFEELLISSLRVAWLALEVKLAFATFLRVSAVESFSAEETAADSLAVVDGVLQTEGSKVEVPPAPAGGTDVVDTQELSLLAAAYQCWEMQMKRAKALAALGDGPLLDLLRTVLLPTVEARAPDDVEAATAGDGAAAG